MISWWNEGFYVPCYPVSSVTLFKVATSVLLMIAGFFGPLGLRQRRGVCSHDAWDEPTERVMHTMHNRTGRRTTRTYARWRKSIVGAARVSCMWSFLIEGMRLDCSYVIKSSATWMPRRLMVPRYLYLLKVSKACRIYWTCISQSFLLIYLQQLLPFLFPLLRSLLKSPLSTSLTPARMPHLYPSE